MNNCDVEIVATKSKILGVKILVFVLVVILLYLATSVGQRIYYMYKGVQCGAQLKGISSHFPGYRLKHNGKNPSSLEELITLSELLSKDKLYCPSNKSTGGEKSYIYRGEDLGKNADPKMILIYERQGNHPIFQNTKLINKIWSTLIFNYGDHNLRHVVFANLNVRSLTEKEFQKAIAYDNILREQSNLMQKPLQ